MFDLDAGLLLRFRYDIHKHPVHNSLGFAVHHLTRPDGSFENISTRIPMRFTITYGAMFPISRGKYKRNVDFIFLRCLNLIIKINSEFIIRECLPPLNRYMLVQCIN